MSLGIFLYFWSLFSENSARCPYLSSKNGWIVRNILSKNLQLYYNKANRFSRSIALLFRQHLAFTAKCVKKCSIAKPKSICEANSGWILACYWDEVNSNSIAGEKRKSRRSLWTSCWNRGMQCG